MKKTSGEGRAAVFFSSTGKVFGSTVLVQSQEQGKEMQGGLETREGKPAGAQGDRLPGATMGFTESSKFGQSGGGDK